jgi:hypothetical protein
MRVTFKINLGSRDADRLGLDYSKCRRGDCLDLTDELGEKLCKSGFASEVVNVKAPVKLEAVPIVDIQTSEPAAKPKGNKKPSF